MSHQEQITKHRPSRYSLLDSQAAQADSIARPTLENNGWVTNIYLRHSQYPWTWSSVIVDLLAGLGCLMNADQDRLGNSRFTGIKARGNCWNNLRCTPQCEGHEQKEGCGVQKVESWMKSLSSVGLKSLRIPVDDCISEEQFIMALPFEM
jgi:hypothetical protein